MRALLNVLSIALIVNLMAGCGYTEEVPAEELAPISETLEINKWNLDFEQKYGDYAYFGELKQDRLYDVIPVINAGAYDVNYQVVMHDPEENFNVDLTFSNPKGVVKAGMTQEIGFVFQVNEGNVDKYASEDKHFYGYAKTRTHDSFAVIFFEDVHKTMRETLIVYMSAKSEQGVRPQALAQVTWQSKPGDWWTVVQGAVVPYDRRHTIELYGADSHNAKSYKWAIFDHYGEMEDAILNPKSYKTWTNIEKCGWYTVILNVDGYYWRDHNATSFQVDCPPGSGL